MRHSVCSVLAVGCTLVSSLALAQPKSLERLGIDPRVLMGTPDSASGSTPSHRVIPFDENRKVPSMQDFRDPGFQELIKQLHEYSQQQNAARRQRRIRSSKSGGNAIRQPRLPEELPGNSSSSFPTPESSSGEIAGGAEGYAVGGNQNEDSETPPSMGGGPQINIKELWEEIQTQSKEALEKYDEAMKAFNQWPQGTVPPDEWLRKVQPLLNPELVRQMNDVIEANRDAASATEDVASKGSLPKSKPDSVISSGDKKPTSSLFKDPSKRLLGAIIGAMDKAGTEWLKNAGKDRKKNSRLKSLAKKTSNWLEKLNLKVTEKSNDIASQRPTFGGTSGAASSRSGSTTSSTESSAWNARQVGVTLLLLAAAIGIAVWLWRRRDDIAAVLPTARAKQLDATAIRDRESLLKACHQLTRRYFGWPSQFWNHRKLFSQLESHVSSQAGDPRSQTVERLRDIYEHARYAPNGLLSSEQLESAQRLYAEIRDEAPAA